MSNGFHWTPLILVTVTMIGCSSEDPETTKIELNGVTVSLTGNPNRDEVEGYLRERGIQQGFHNADHGMAATIVVGGVMTTTTKGQTALSQCIATSGLNALDNLVEFMGGQEIHSQVNKTNIETQQIDSMVLDGGIPITFNTDDGSVRYTIESRSETITHMLKGQDNKFINRRFTNKAIRISDDSGTVCAHEYSSSKDGTKQLWDCDIKPLNKLFRNNQRRSDQHVVAKWLHSELDGTSCYSAFGFSFPR